MMPRLTLSDTEAHLWLVRTEEITDPELLRRYHGLLSPEEEHQHQQFATEELRREYLITRALCRTMLSHYAEVAPADWQFVVNAFGRPEIVRPVGVPPLRFNLSHTHGLVACLMTLEADCGVDVEDATRAAAMDDVAARCFSARELASLNGLVGDDYRQRFFAYWTLKESYVKARGLGMSLPLEHLSFHLADGDAITASFGAALSDEPRQWQFSLHRPTVRHILATAIRQGGRAPLPLAVRFIVPRGVDFCPHR